MPSSPPPLLSIIIVTFKSEDLIDQCLEPLVPIEKECVEVVVWDNASPDKTVVRIKENYPWVKLIASPENIGFSRANNAAISYCSGDVIVFLNPDAFVDSVDDLKNMASILRARKDLAAVGPQLINVDGSHQIGDAGWRTNLRSVIGHYMFVHRIFVSFPSLYLSNPKLLFRTDVDVDWICGACLTVRRDVLDHVGGLSERIFMYGEDVEWGERCRRHGYGLLYIPGIKVLHLQGATQRDRLSNFYSTKAMDALAVQISKQNGPVLFFLFRIILIYGYLLRSALYAFSGLARQKSFLVSKSGLMWRYACHAATLSHHSGSAE